MAEPSGARGGGPPEERGPWSRPGLGWAAGLGLALLSAARLPGAGPEPLLAWRGGEAWGHLWSWWWHGLALPAWPRGTELALGTADWPVVDLLPALLGAGLSRLLGPLAAWDLLLPLAVLGAFWGGWFAARRAGGLPLLGGLLLALGPVFAGSLASGLTEDWAVGLLAAVLALALHPGRGWGWALGLGLSLGLLALCGPYLGWLGGTVALLAGLLHLLRAPRAAPRWALAALLALPPALGALLWLGPRAYAGAGLDHGLRPEEVEPLWRLSPWGGADLLAFLVPGPAELPPDAVVRLHPVYLGLLPLLLALRGGRSRWWAVLLGALFLAPGDALRLGGHPLAPWPAGRLLDLLPLGGRVHHAARLFLAGQVALAVLAARGAARLRRPALPALLAALELALLSPLPWPLPACSAAPLPVLRELDALSPGGLVALPIGGPGVHPQRALLDQRVHGRRLLLDPNRPGPPPCFRDRPGGRWLAGLAFPGSPPPPPAEALCFLPRCGAAVLLASPGVSPRLEALLGPPDAGGAERGAAWDLARRCALGALRSSPDPSPKPPEPEP